jgi:hypothetical protein
MNHPNGDGGNIATVWHRNQWRRKFTGRDAAVLDLLASVDGFPRQLKKKITSVAPPRSRLIVWLWPEMILSRNDWNVVGECLNARMLFLIALRFGMPQEL